MKQIATALLDFARYVPNIKKDATADGAKFSYDYATLNNILDHVKPLLTKVGVIIFQAPHGVNELITRLIHAESGEYLESIYTMTPARSDPQSLGSNITYQKRYALVAMLALSLDEDDDGANASKPATNGAAKKEPVATNGNPGTLPEMKVGDDNFNKAVKALKENKRTLADIKKKFYLPNVTETVLMREVKEIVNEN
jgi:hypothetical protein